MEARAIAKYVRMSPIKVGVALNLARGKNIQEAFAILQHTPKGTAVIISKVLESAIANAENNREVDIEGLYIAEALVGVDPTLKRFKLIDHGRTFRINRGTSSIILVAEEGA